MPKSLFVRLALAAMLALPAVGASAADPVAAPASDIAHGREVTRRALAALAESHWLADGRDDAPRVVYVFIDPNCKFCTKFWSDARPWVESGKVQLRHIVVAVIAPSSVGKAAAILAAPDPAKRLVDYERGRAFGVVRQMAEGQHPSMDDPSLLPLSPVPPPIEQEIREHDRMFQELGIRGTPGLVFAQPDGQLAILSGVAPQDLERVLGPR